MARGFIPLADQMRFMWQELQGPEAGTLQAFNQRAAQGNIPGSAADYATLFDQQYERSGGARDTEARAYANDVFGAVGTDAFENLPPNAKFAYSFLTHKGLTPEQAAGVTGRLMVESYARVDPNARNTMGGGSGTYGIAQWRGPRLEALADYAGVSMDDIRNLPISTPEGNYYPTRGIGQTQGAGPMGLLDTQPTQQPQQSGFWGNFAGGILADPDRRARLAMALEGMMLNPNQGVIQSAQAGIEQRRTQGQINKTMEWLAQQPGGEQFAQMADAVGVGPALQFYLEAQKSGGKVLTGEQINQLYPGANVPPENLYNQSPDGKISQVGGGGTTVNVGGTQTTAGWEAIDKAYAETWLRDSTSGLADVSNQAAQISEVLGKLEIGEPLTGPIVGVQGDFIRAITNPEAQDAKDRVEQVVQRSLREVLGAQFTQAEGDRLIARAYNINLPPQQNAARLRALFTSLQSVAAQKAAMRDYFNQNGTLQGFSGDTNIPTIDDFITQMDMVTSSPAGKTLTYDPATGEFR